jgi:hypothetical protein
MRVLRSAAFVVAALLATCVFAKGEGVGLWMEGQVSEVRAEGKNIHLVVTGRFWFEQYRGQQRSVVEVKNLRGGAAVIPATIRQGKPFFAMVNRENGWGGGAIRQPGALLEILRTASGSGRIVKFELVDARLKFGREGRFRVESADTLRATDHALH